MKAYRITRYGADPVFGTVEVPTPQAGEALVRVAAASFNPLDTKLQQGILDAYFPLRFPYTLGTDFAGTIEGLDEGDRTFAAGNRVLARTAPTAGGGMADYAVVPVDQLVRIPEQMPFEDAAGLPTAAGTAWQALFEVAGLEAGQTVLVHAGAGGVGSFAIQFARRAGARVVATASGSGIAIAERLGADLVIDHRGDDFARRIADVDVVLDTIGGDTQARSFEVLRSGGVLASIVSPPDEALARARKVTGTFVFHSSDAGRLRTVLEQVVAGVEVLIDRVVASSETAGAFAHQASGRARGKIIVRF